MKFLRVLLALSMLFCGLSIHARADGIDFRATVLDGPNDCLQDNTGCNIHDPSAQLTIALSQAACPNNVTSNLPYGCYVGDNLTGETITSLSLIFNGAPYENQTPSCDANGQGNVPSVFLVVTCEQVGSTYVLDFAGGTGVPTGTDFVFFEEGADPSLFNGTGTITVAAATPEPDSLLLLSTGVAMAGLFFFSQRRRLVEVRRLQ
jgi:hypothetical protein